MKTKESAQNRKPAHWHMLLLVLCAIAACSKNIPQGLETVTGLDGSVWERVSESGFGNENNISVVTMTEYKGHLYAMTRNEVQGGEIWRTAGNNLGAGAVPRRPDERHLWQPLDQQCVGRNGRL